jgi:hypothetical protein
MLPGRRERACLKKKMGTYITTHSFHHRQYKSIIAKKSIKGLYDSGPHRTEQARILPHVLSMSIQKLTHRFQTKKSDEVRRKVMSTESYVPKDFLKSPVKMDPCCKKTGPADGEEVRAQKVFLSPPNRRANGFNILYRPLQSHSSHAPQ